MIESHINKGSDFSYYEDAPLGARPEVMNTCAIKKLVDEAQTKGYSEYLSLFFKNNPSVFKLNAVKAPKEFSRPKYRLNLDYQEDYDLLEKIFFQLNIEKKPIGLSTVINYLDINPKLLDINKNVTSVYRKGKLKKELDKITLIRVNDN